jgi:hypothetical protein
MEALIGTEDPSRLGFEVPLTSGTIGGRMSALGHKRTFAVQNGMSALPPIADMSSATRDVRFVPIADIPPFKRRQLVYTGSMTY